MSPDPTSIAVVGLGYVGCVSAACLAKLGHLVTGVDRDESKVASVNEKRAPFFEPGLQVIVEETVNAGRLRAHTSLAGALATADVAMICVGTPSEANGNLGLGQLRRVVDEIGSTLAARTRPLIVAIRSTVFPGTCEEVVIPALGASPHACVVSNPEFLREGSAVKDFLEPSLLVAGGDDPAAVDRVAQLYSALNVSPCRVSLRTAEMIKYACNCFHAVKITFANEIGTLSAQLGISAEEVLSTLCEDRKLNISAAYMKPGFAFGGSCLPKDLRALNYRASRLDLDLPMLEAVLDANDRHLGRAIQTVAALPAKRLGIFGLAFKENTDDLRESPVVTLIEYLIGKGRELKIFDPHIRLEEIYGANRQFVLNAVPHIGKLMEPSLDALVSGSDHIVIAQNPSREMRDHIAASGLPVVDLTRLG